MSLKECVAVACMVLAASLLAYGNGIVSGDQSLPLKFNADGAVMGNVRSAPSEECAVFRSSLQAVPEGGSGVQRSERNGSYPAERTGEQEGILSLPEPHTGVMLCIGVIAIIYLAGAGGTSRS
jgi:hypothetical protein